MVWASQALRITTILTQYPTATVPADIVKRLNVSFLAAYYDDAFSCHIEQEIITLMRDLRDVTRHDPLLAKQALTFAFEDGLILVKGSVKRPARPLRSNKLVNLVCAGIDQGYSAPKTRPVFEDFARRIVSRYT